ncbi:hypothetical protein CROQUDRAFT_697690, partial [Cronartium quercuum f. sp. fusiforme G11]
PDFEAFLEHDLQPMMNPWSASHSVVVMDNALIHHNHSPHLLVTGTQDIQLTSMVSIVDVDPPSNSAWVRKMHELHRQHLLLAAC